SHSPSFFNATVLTSSCRRKVGGVMGRSRLVDRVMTSQPHDLAREFQTTHNTHVKRVTSRVR
ncbi:MAG: hypothetical protein PV344_05800, partial [Anaplasma sp.]|nr:hypothetical protein [Anaplasma sp.]